LNLPYDLILNTLKAPIHFRATDEYGFFFPDDEKFFREAEKGTDHILTKVCRLPLHHV
jgi:hypothetical protein